MTELVIHDNPPIDLPDSVHAHTVFEPIEDCALQILRDAFPDMPVVSLIPEDPAEMLPWAEGLSHGGPFLLCRKTETLEGWRGDRRGWLDYAVFTVDIFTQDPDGDAKGGRIGEAVRVAFERAGRESKRFPGYGYLRRQNLWSAPARKSDWATSSGPVQYADLPTGWWRYETKFEIWVRVQRT